MEIIIYGILLFLFLDHAYSYFFWEKEKERIYKETSEDVSFNKGRKK